MTRLSWLVLFIMLALALPGAAQTYPDIQGHPARRAIEKLSIKGILRGGADGRFQPEASVSRLEVVLHLTRALGLEGDPRTVPAFRDLGEVPVEARSAVAAALALGFVPRPKVELRKGNVLYTLAVEKTVYGPTEPVGINFTIANTGKDTVQFEFSSGQQFDIVIRSGNQEVARWSLGRAFTQALLTLPLAPGQAFVYPDPRARWLPWRQLDQNDRPVPPGVYDIVGIHTTRKDPTSLSLVFHKGLVTGFPDNTFRPKAEVTRAELTQWFLRALGREAEALTGAFALNFADAGQVPPWARGYVGLGTQLKVLLPYPDNTIRAHRPATRADVAVALDALMEAHGKYDYVRGTLREVRTGSPNLIVLADDRAAVRTFRVSPGSLVYRNNRSVPITDLKVGDRVLMLLTASAAGEAAYIEATGQ
ncbi:MAG: S-layer homology domain-containing protein [Armatimonadetes bacterium]|nr:S-layer homology domain-containing protein [Armatimonadota bacterium]